MQQPTRHKDFTPISYDMLRKIVARGSSTPVRAERYSQSLVKVVMTGPADYLLERSTDLVAYLRGFDIEIPQ